MGYLLSSRHNCKYQYVHRVVSSYVESSLPQKKQNRRVDNLLYILLQIARNLIYEQLKKVKMGKNTHKITEINKRHKIANDSQQQSTIHQMKESVWEIQSLSKKGTIYVMEKKLDQCSCKLRCLSCDICTHMYSCTCMDATLHSIICKHVHLLVISLSTGTVCVTNSIEIDEEQSDIGSSEDNPSGDDSDDEMTTDDESNDDEIANVENNPVIELPAFNTIEYYSQVLHNPTDVNKKKEKVEDLTHNLLLLIHLCTDTDVLQTVQEHLKSAISVLKAKNDQCNSTISFTPIMNPAPNQNHATQLRFYSTVKTRKKEQKTMG